MYLINISAFISNIYFICYVLLYSYMNSCTNTRNKIGFRAVVMSTKLAAFTCRSEFNLKVFTEFAGNVSEATETVDTGLL